MPALTSTQISEIADRIFSIGQSVGDYRIKNRNTLTEGQNLALKNLHRELMDKVDEFHTTAATLVMDEIESSMNTIKSITADIDKTYKKLQNVQKAIDIAASAVSLAAAIFTMKPAAIGKSILNLANTIKDTAAAKSITGTKSIAPKKITVKKKTVAVKKTVAAKKTTTTKIKKKGS